MMYAAAADHTLRFFLVLLPHTVLKQLLSHNADPARPSDNLRGFSVFLVASSFLVERKVEPASENIGSVIFDFLDFHAHLCNHAEVVVGVTGTVTRGGYDGIQKCAKDEFIVINPCPGISGDVNTA